jgi:2-polyprenyl-3-methyl-5-hydroxy-6-metoxy-1,4-benzoquinol methylase
MSVAQSQPDSAPFDAIARRYDEIFTNSCIGQAQRTSVWTELAKTFREGERILDLGCGTGVDACFLAECGVKSVALDCSREMISVAMHRVQAAGKQNWVQPQVLAVEQIANLGDQGPFDGAFSNFGALNCVADLGSLAKNLGMLLRPGATALLCFLGPNCVWEIGWYLAHANPRKAFRRWQPEGTTARFGDGPPMQVRYPSVRSVSRTFSPEFRLRSCKGVGVVVPPSYVEDWAFRFPFALQVARRADRLLGRCPGTRALADHMLLEFVRQPV